MDITDVTKYQTIEIACPHCLHQHVKTIGWLNDHDRFVCDCGEQVHINPQFFLAQRRQIEMRLRKYLLESELQS